MNIKKIVKLIVDPDYRFIEGGLHGWYSNMPDDIYLKKKFKIVMGRDLNLQNPSTYNEKLQWLKLNDHKDIYTQMVDKYDAKKYVASIIGTESIIPTIGVYKDLSEINFDTLPNKFVMKCTHDSGGVVVVKDKRNVDLKKLKRRINFSLNRNYYLTEREWPYKNIKPRIIVEKYIADSPKDYKFFMFNGKMDSVMVCTDRDKGCPTFRFYDKNWNRLYYQRPELEPIDNINKPENFDQMIDIARKLSKGFPQLRIDMYNVQGKVYFGEITFFNESGYDTEISYDTDLKWGKLTDLTLVHNKTYNT